MSTKNWMARSFWYLLAVLISTLALSGSFGSVKATSSRTLLQAGDPPTNITITAPSVGTINQNYTFTASVSPETAATPITYTWSVTKDDGTTETVLVNGKWEQRWSGPPVGVDCVGLINNAWRIGTRAGMSNTNEGSRPILFKDMTFHTEAQVRALIENLETEYFHEEDADGQAASGPKHWHVFTVIVRKL